MPTISNIRFTHVIYENGHKRYNDEIFRFYGHNGAIVLENGGGKTVFIQTAVQAVIPHADLAGRKLKDTLQLDSGPAHIAIEWMLADKPRRRYAVTSVSLFQTGNNLDSYRYVYEYGEHDANGLEQLPFVKMHMDKVRPADKGEIHDYYVSMERRYPLQAKTFATIKEYRAYLEEQLQIIADEWGAIVKINETEGGIEHFFDECKATTQLFDRLLIPTVEQSIEGFEQGAFARMFEAHREGFKKYKELKEQIEENRRILDKLGQYARLCAGLERVEQDYEGSRAAAKSYWQLTLEHVRELEAERNRLFHQEEDWKRRQEELYRKGKSLEVAKERQEQAALETKLQLILDDLERAEERLGEAEVQYYSLQYAEIREKQQMAAARIKRLDEQLSRLSYAQDEEMLQQRWELNGAKLRYIFTVQEQKWNDERADQERLLEQLNEAIRSLGEEQRQWDADRVEMETALLLNEAAQRGKREQMDHIARSILANPQLDKVERQMPLWAEEEQRLEQSRIELLQQLKKLEAERVDMENRRKAVGEERAHAERELARLQEQEKLWREEYEELKHELVLLRPAWERIGSLYEKQASVQKQLEEAIERQRQQKQKLLMKERLAFRYVDDHGEQRLFFADAAVSKWVEQWSHQFSLLQTGTDYIHSLAVAGAEVERSDRLWAVTLITTEHEKPSLQSKLQQVNGNFAFPIRVLSIQEAANDVQDNGMSGSVHDVWVVPGHWMGNEQPVQFAQWKAELTEQAVLVKGEREKVEVDIAVWQSVQRKLTSFLAKYPLAVQQELEQRKLAEHTSVLEHQRALERLDDQLTVNRQTEEQRRKAEADAAAYIQQLGIWLRDGQQYMRLQHEVSKLEQERLPLQEQVALLCQQLQRSRKWLEEKQVEHKKLYDQIYRTDVQLQLLRQDERYVEVQSCSPVHCKDTIGELKELRKALELERKRIFQERTQLEAELVREQGREQECMHTMKELLMEHPHIVQDVQVLFAAEERKRQGWADIQECRQLVQGMGRERTAVERELQTKKGVLETLLRQFKDRFAQEEPDRFQESLRTVEERLQEQATTLQHEGGQLKRHRLQTDKQQAEMEQVMIVWNKHLLVHMLEDMGLSPAMLTIEEQMEFGYHRQREAERCIQQLTERHERLRQERGMVLQGRQYFKEFCSSQVKDVKLKQMTIQGIETKQGYEEVKEFQQSMEQRIQMVIHIGEQTLQTHDRELQQYIQHIHAHLQLIMQELREIPKKTRVKTADGWKEIYSFTIPNWEEEEGKARIRNHLDWMINQLDRFAAEHELMSWQEQQAMIRKDIDKWLDSRQLLQVVLLGEGMKVSCRKVTNQHQVTRAAYSWEQSNRWSGGEKWSKNMTLFLGLLNYVAERKQYVQTKMKRHRTVILDNPFGKASSDHVLGPVFFIAEQLGFQIIALTAHMEGKFLQDYFPIVYSCRLRQAVDPAKQIVTAEQNVQLAYFRDHDPDTLERIGSSVVQMEWFEQ